MKIIAFSPSHITAFFEVCYKEDVYKTGSRGAGICLSLGSYAKVRTGGNKIIIRGNIGKGEVTKEAIRNLFNYAKEKVGIKVEIKNDLPFSQGFGISASSSLASTIAISNLLKIPCEKALQSVHLAEVKKKTGLGDAISSFCGGMEIRKEPGIKGNIEKIECGEKIIIAIVGKRIDTRNILKDEKMVDKINDIGKQCIDEFIKKPSIENLFDLSLKFALETGIANYKMQKILKEANKIGKASMAMLGNSIFALYSKEMKKFLSKYQYYECFIDNEGARILATFFP